MNDEDVPFRSTPPVDPVDESTTSDPNRAAAAPPGADGSGPTAATPSDGARRPTRSDRHRKPIRTRRRAPWWELPALVAVAIVIAIVVKTFVVQPFYIPSQSMENTLYGCPGCHGDRILVNKLIYDFRAPHPGDIVVFNAPTGWNNEPASTPPSNPVLRTVRGFGQLIGFVPPDGEVLVKRVIATGGETVKGNASGAVFVSSDGGRHYRKLIEPFVFDDPGQSQRPFGPVRVPAGRLWVMGDHRTDSADSRYHCGVDGTDAVSDLNCDPVSSTVPVSNVIGKAFVIAWPPSRWRTLGTPATFKSEAIAVADPLTPVGVGAVAPAAVIVPFAWRRRRRRNRDD